MLILRNEYQIMFFLGDKYVFLVTIAN